MARFLLATAFGLLCIGSLAGCSHTTGNSQPHEHATGPIKVQHSFAGSGPVKVVCTTGMVADLARNVGGEHVEVSHLMGAGVDPHLYKASPGDVSQLNAADVIFYSGLHLEGKMTELFARMADRKPAFPVAERVPADRILHADGGAADPHVWFDVSLWREAADTVREVLSQFDPAHAADYERNAAAYQAKLNDLHDYAREQLATVAKDRRVLVTAHDAFQYFGRAYDIEVRGIQGISTDSEAGVRQVNELVDFLVDRKIKAVFVETSVSDQNVRSLLEGCKSRGHDVVIGGELFSDAMGEDGTAAGTYEGMVRHNVDTVVKALR